MPFLKLENIVAGYEGAPVLKQLSIEIEENTVVGLLGRNGMGKSTVLRTIVGLLTPESGTIQFKEKAITDWDPHQTYNVGISLVREDRGIFPDLTVIENLQVPVIRDEQDSYSIDELFDFFPRLQERKHAKGNHLSGGEQQMLAIARALRSKPRLLLLDEPSEGLAPQIVQNIADIIREITETGTTILLVEQNVDFILDLTSYIYTLENGKIVYEGTTEETQANREKMEQHLQVHSNESA